VAKYFLRLGDREVEAELEETPEGLRVLIDSEWQAVSVRRLGESPRYVLMLGDRVLDVLVEEEAGGFNLQIGGASYEVETVRGRRGRRTQESDHFENGRWVLHAPLTGVVIEVRTAVGETVAQNDVLMVVEAMKMLNELRARVSGEVSAVHAAVTDRVELGSSLIEISEVVPPAGAADS
jgi:biotin carboxyl carrier protein